MSDNSRTDLSHLPPSTPDEIRAHGRAAPGSTCPKS